MAQLSAHLTEPIDLTSGKRPPKERRHGMFCFTQLYNSYISVAALTNYTNQKRWAIIARRKRRKYRNRKKAISRACLWDSREQSNAQRNEPTPRSGKISFVQCQGLVNNSHCLVLTSCPCPAPECVAGIVTKQTRVIPAKLADENGNGFSR